jgi:hypothetical protein
MTRIDSSSRPPKKQVPLNNASIQEEDEHFSLYEVLHFLSKFLYIFVWQLI